MRDLDGLFVNKCQCATMEFYIGVQGGAHGSAISHWVTSYNRISKTKTLEQDSNIYICVYIYRILITVFIMADHSAPASPLSDLTPASSTSDPFEEHEIHLAANRPSKRQRIGGDPSIQPSNAYLVSDLEMATVSSDSSGDVPNSLRYGNLKLEDDDSSFEQITTCEWLACEADAFENMDKLVDHIHEEHVDARQKSEKYTCEWIGCDRKGGSHASAYALKAHLRKHTKEKPFYCTLPGRYSVVVESTRLITAECDRAFSRTDALTKHMRTVHEAEPLRPSEAIAKTMQPPVKVRLRINKLEDGQNPGVNGTVNGSLHQDPSAYGTVFAKELGFTREEEEMNVTELYRLLRRQVHWEEEEGELLKARCEVMENLRKHEWMEKEVLLDQVIQSEIDWNGRRSQVLASLATLPGVHPQTESGSQKQNTTDMSSPKDTPMPDLAPEEDSEVPGNQLQTEDQHHAAAALVSLHAE